MFYSIFEYQENLDIEYITRHTQRPLCLIKEMKLISSLILIILASIGCFSQVYNDSTEILTDTITTRENLDNYVNTLVTIKGKISNTKIPQILGIDVDCNEYNPKGKIGIVTGVLIKTIVLEKDVERYSQNRGAGVFYRLKEPGSDYDAKVTILKK